MEALVYVVVGVAGFVLGILIIAIIGVIRRHRQPPVGHPVPQGVHLSDADVDRMAKSILDASTDTRSSAIQQYAREWRLFLNLELIAPREEDALDPERHAIEGTVRTADPMRDGTVADVMSPGIQVRGGRVIVPARIMRHEFERPPPRPGLATTVEPQASTVPMPGRQVEPGPPARGPEPQREMDGA